jgi:hypothetical protein
MWLSLLIKIGLPLLLVGGGLWYVNDRAYNRGHAAGWADNTAAQKKAIQIKKDFAEKNKTKLDKLTPAEADAELIKRCIAACGPDQQCQKACEE